MSDLMESWAMSPPPASLAGPMAETVPTAPPRPRPWPLVVSVALHACAVVVVASSWTAPAVHVAPDVALSVQTTTPQPLRAAEPHPVEDLNVTRARVADPLAEFETDTVFDEWADFVATPDLASALPADDLMPRFAPTRARVEAARARVATRVAQPSAAAAHAAFVSPPVPSQAATSQAFQGPPPLVLSKPVALHSNALPRYPSRARRRGVSGVVLLAIDVGADGAVAAVRVADSSGHAALDEAAVTAARAWRYRPATRGSESVPFTLRQPVRFGF